MDILGMGSQESCRAAGRAASQCTHQLALPPPVPQLSIRKESSVPFLLTTDLNTASAAGERQLSGYVAG